MIEDGQYKEFEKLVKKGSATLEDLSEEMFQKFKEWIETPQVNKDNTEPCKYDT